MTLCESELCQSQSILLCVLMEHARWEGRMELCSVHQITNTRVPWVNGCMVAHRLTPVWMTWVCMHEEDNVLCCRMGHVGLTREWHAPFIPDYWRQVWNYPNIVVFLKSAIFMSFCEWKIGHIIQSFFPKRRNTISLQEKGFCLPLLNGGVITPTLWAAYEAKGFFIIQSTAYWFFPLGWKNQSLWNRIAIGEPSGECCYQYCFKISRGPPRTEIYQPVTRLTVWTV